MTYTILIHQNWQLSQQVLCFWSSDAIFTPRQASFPMILWLDWDTQFLLCFAFSGYSMKKQIVPIDAACFSWPETTKIWKSPKINLRKNSAMVTVPIILQPSSCFSQILLLALPSYSHTCYTYCQGFLPCLFLPFQSIHMHFFWNLSQLFLCWLWLTRGSCVGPQNEIGHPAKGRFLHWVPMEYKQAKKNMTCGMMTCEMNNLEIDWSLCSALM